jgi:hypothetical protein
MLDEPVPTDSGAGGFTRRRIVALGAIGVLALGLGFVALGGESKLAVPEGAIAGELVMEKRSSGSGRAVHSAASAWPMSGRTFGPTGRHHSVPPLKQDNVGKSEGTHDEHQKD